MMAKDQYIEVYLVDHPLFPGKTRTYEHRVVMAEHLGRPLKKGEEVHHLHPPKSNNNISNLALKKNRKEHMAEHKHPCSDETRKKISTAKKGKPLPWMIGHTYNVGRVRSDDFKERVSKSLKGRPKSDDHKKALSASAMKRRGEMSRLMKGRKVSERTRELLRKPKSEEHKQALREAALRDWARRKAKEVV